MTSTLTFSAIRTPRLCRHLRTKALFSSRTRLHRNYSTKPDAVELDYDLLTPANGNARDQPLVILHGLFGSKRNWGSLSKAFLRDLQRPIYSIDLRNHGTSPHASPMTYDHMAADVLHFFEKHSLEDVSLLGHSLGGKVAMATALAQSPRLSNLVVADIAPSRGALSEEFQEYINIMKRIEEKKVQTRKEAEDMLAEYEQDPNVRLFLLTNFVPPDKNDPQSGGRFRVPLNFISDAIPFIGDFPHEPSSGVSWDGNTLFIKGSKSNYINKHTIAPAEAFFPRMRLETLDAGHWLHAERPGEFIKLVRQFLVKE